MRTTSVMADVRGNDLFIVFSGSRTPGGPTSCVCGPFRSVSFGRYVIWAWQADDGRRVRVATQAVGSACWELDDRTDPPWMEARVISPPSPAAARPREEA